jgi:hypothetical protein
VKTQIAGYWNYDALAHKSALAHFSANCKYPSVRPSRYSDGTFSRHFPQTSFSSNPCGSLD